MTEFQSAAYVFAQSVAALAAIEGMKAENQRRAHLGQGPAWGEADFAKIEDQFGISHNAVSSIFQEAAQ